MPVKKEVEVNAERWKWRWKDNVKEEEWQMVTHVEEVEELLGKYMYLWAGGLECTGNERGERKRICRTGDV